MKTVHREKQTGHTDAIFEEIPAIICHASRSSKSQENDPFHRNVWPGLKTHALQASRLFSLASRGWVRWWLYVSVRESMLPANRNVGCHINQTD